jgi:hypothetical protein
MAPLSAGDFYYYIDYPGADATQPSFRAYKWLPNDASGMSPPPPPDYTGTVLIGVYASLGVAQAACQSDAYPGTAPLLAANMPIIPNVQSSSLSQGFQRIGL